MRIPAARLYRAFAELDELSDAECEVLLRRAERRRPAIAIAPAHQESRPGRMLVVPKELLEARADDPLHHEDGALLRVATERVDGHHVRMRHPRQRPGLAPQPLLPGPRQVIVVQHLQRDLAIEVGIERREHHAHAALPQRLAQLVARPHRAHRRRRAPTGARRCRLGGGGPVFCPGR